MAQERRLRVLLVDDEPDMLDLLQAIVTATTWEIVGQATNGVDALRVSARMAPDVAVVDYRMPGENGLIVAERLKGLHPGAIVIMLSANLHIEQQALASGFVDRFVPKGDLRRLRRVIEEVHDERRPQLGDA